MSDVEITKIVVLNDSNDFEVCGDVSVWPSVEAACSHLEPASVCEALHAIRGDGQRLTITVADSSVNMLLGVDRNDYSHTLRRWLRNAALTSQLSDDASIEELIAVVGFS